MIAAELVTDAAEAEALTGAWDALAVATAQPMSSPAWMLAWWRHAAPRGARLRLVVAREEEEVVGLLPFYVDPARKGHYRVLADTLASTTCPLAVAGREWEVAEAGMRVLAEAAPPPDVIALERLPLASHWTVACREGWPGRIRPLSLRYGVQPVATVSLEGTVDDWYASRSYNFRRNLRRGLRRFEKAGGTWRMATPATAAADIETLVRLHRARWHGASQSHLLALGDGFPALMSDVAAGLLGGERFRLWTLELKGEPIASDLALAAGGEVNAYNGGWDTRHHRLSPAILSTFRLIEDAFARGDRRFNIGWGMLDYKRLFATGLDAVAWDALVPISTRLPLGVARAAPVVGVARIGMGLRRALPDEQVDRLRARLRAG